MMAGLTNCMNHKFLIREDYGTVFYFSGHQVVWLERHVKKALFLTM